MLKVLTACAWPLLVMNLMACGQLKKTDSAQKIPLEDFFRNPSSDKYKISPNGQNVAFLKSHERRMNIYVQSSTGQGEAKRITEVLDRDIKDFFWKGNQHIVFVKDFGGDENDHVYATSITDPKPRDLTPFEGIKARVVHHLDDIHPTEIIIGLNERNPQTFDLFRLNILTGKKRLVLRNPGSFTSFVLDHKGVVRVAIATDGVNSTIYHRHRSGRPFTQLMKLDFKTTFKPLAFNSSNTKIYALSNLNRDKMAVVEFNPRTRKESQVLFHHPVVDSKDVFYSQKRKSLIAAVYETWKQEMHFFDQSFSNIYSDIQSKLPHRQIRFYSMDKSESQLIVRSFSDRSHGAYHLYNVKEKSLTLLGQLSPWLDKNKMAPTRPISYKTKDGLTLHGYLTLPAHKKSKDLPLVVIPHGGPWSRDSWGFQAETQFLANRGYGVFKVNYRGSKGYGKKFWEASFKQWGKKMLSDINEGVDWLVSQGIADKKQTCIYGKSYGGYTALAALTFSPKHYECGVSYVGISNLFTLLDSIPPYWEPYREMLYEMIGHPTKDKDLLMSASPLFHVNNIKSPLFIAHGANDPRVKQKEADQIVESLRKRGVGVSYLLKKNEGHGFKNEENRFEFYRALEAFLTQHI